MNKILIENDFVDPYMILGVSKEDTREKIELMYKKKAKLLHPDKSKLRDKTLREKAFRMLQESYNYIKATFNENKLSSNPFDNNRFKHNSKRYFEENKGDTKSKDTKDTKDTKDFNTHFENSRGTRPGDFGYKTTRIQNLNEYNDFNYTPKNIFEEKQFDSNEFNKMFEYNKKDLNENNSELVHQTTDGFYAYNSGGCDDSVASVSNYNGLMVVGDNYGESGVGYNGTQFGDFKSSFNGNINPEETITEFNSRIKQGKQKDEKVIGKINKSDFKKLLNEKIRENEKINKVRANNSSKANFRKENDDFEKRKSLKLKQEIEKDKKMVLEFKGMFNDRLIEDAQNNRLDMSDDTFGDNFNEKLSLEENVSRRVNNFLEYNKI